MKDGDLLPLGDVIRALRSEIVGAMADRDRQAVVFTLGPIEVELTAVAKREGGPKGAIKFQVLGIGAELGADAKFASEKAQKVKLTLKPRERGDDGLLGDIHISRDLGPDAADPGDKPLGRR